MKVALTPLAAASITCTTKLRTSQRPVPKKFSRCSASQCSKCADIVAAIKKQNLPLAQVSRLHGLSSGTLANALIRPWPEDELIIASYLGIPPSEIWPGRYYDEQGNLINRESMLRRTNSKSIESFE